MTKALKLRAQSQEDLLILSSLVQDMTLRRDGLMFEPGPHRFVLVGNRFRHEEKRSLWRRISRPHGSRVKSFLRFEAVTQARLKGLAQAPAEAVFTLLAITAEPQEPAEAGWRLDLVLSGGARVSLETEVIEAVLTDAGPDRRAERRPDHNRAYPEPDAGFNEAGE